MAIPTTSFSESSPAGSEGRSLGAWRIRESKTQFREVLAVDHVFSSTGNGTTWGRHNKATMIAQAESPSMVADTVILFTKAVSGKTELFFDSYDSTRTEMQLSSGGNWVGGLVGEVVPWTGLLSAIPDGWALCDGTAGTPNLIGKHLRQVDTNATEPGLTGGSDAVTSIISHTHATTFTAAGEHIHSGTTDSGGNGGNISGYAVLWYGAPEGGFETTTGSHAHSFSIDSSGSHTHTVSLAETGESSIDNRPAYYEAAFIIKT